MVRNETGSQLYLIIPADMNRDLVVQFAESEDFGNIACALLQSGHDGKVERGHAETLLRFAHAANIPLLMENDISAAADLGAGGVHIPAGEDLYTEARNALGDDAIIGVECGLSRHAGLTFGEMGADYIAFRESAVDTPCEVSLGLEEMIAWWSEISNVTGVAMVLIPVFPGAT